MKGLINHRILILLIFFISLDSFSQDICDRCFGFGRVACWKCDGATITNRDKNGLGVFCSECACNYCDKDYVGTGRCGKCKGLRYVKKSALRTSENDGSWGDALEGALEITGIVFLQSQYSKTLEKYKANYHYEKRKYREYEENKKRLLREQAERERKRRIEKQRNKKQFTIDDIKLASKGELTEDYKAWLGSFHLSNSRNKNIVNPSYFFHFRKSKHGAEKFSKYINTRSPRNHLYILPETPVIVHLKLQFIAAIISEKFKDSVDFYGSPVVYFTVAKKLKYSKKMMFKKHAMPKLNGLKGWSSDGLYSTNDYVANKENAVFRNHKVSYALSPFINKFSKEGDIYELSIYIGSKKSNSQELELKTKKPLKTISFEVISLKQLEKKAKEIFKRKPKEIIPYYNKDWGYKTIYWTRNK